MTSPEAPKGLGSAEALRRLRAAMEQTARQRSENLHALAGEALGLAKYNASRHQIFEAAGADTPDSLAPGYAESMEGVRAIFRRGAQPLRNEISELQSAIKSSEQLLPEASGMGSTELTSLLSEARAELALKEGQLSETLAQQERELAELEKRYRQFENGQVQAGQDPVAFAVETVIKAHGFARADQAGGARSGKAPEPNPAVPSLGVGEGLSGEHERLRSELLAKVQEEFDKWQKARVAEKERQIEIVKRAQEACEGIDRFLKAQQTIVTEWTTKAGACRQTLHELGEEIDAGTGDKAKAEELKRRLAVELVPLGRLRRTITGGEAKIQRHAVGRATFEKLSDLRRKMQLDSNLQGLTSLCATIEHQLKTGNSARDRFSWDDMRHYYIGGRGPSIISLSGTIQELSEALLTIASSEDLTHGEAMSTDAVRARVLELETRRADSVAEMRKISE